MLKWLFPVGLVVLALGLWVTPGQMQTADPPTYYDSIEPILQANCFGCHTEGQIGYAAFPMDDTLRLLESAQDIAFVTQIGYMPPYPPGEASPEMVGERRLTEEEIALLVAWAEAGAPLGNPQNATPYTPVMPEVALRRDAVLTMSESYTPDPAVSDDYRCFLFEPAFAQDTFITGFEIEPGVTTMVHHALLFQVDAAQYADAQAKEAEDDLPGWECLGGTGVSGEILPLIQDFIQPVADAAGGFSVLFRLLQTPEGQAELQTLIDSLPDAATYNEQIARIGGLAAINDFMVNSSDRMRSGQSAVFNGLIGAWTPGAQPVQYPTGTGVQVAAGSYLVLQIHYNTLAGVAPDQSSIVLDVAYENTEPLSLMSMVAPVEIPCADDATSTPCQRDTAIDQAEFPLTAHYILYGCDHTPEDFATQEVSQITSTCDYTVQQAGWAIQVFSHMHELGASSRIELNPDTPAAQILLDIPIWDFHWQSQYALVTPVPVAVGDTVRVTCTWDATRAEGAPRYRVWGERTADEMCLHWVMLLPAQNGKTLSDYGY